ncbi:MAG: DUF1549 domain-containing protein, partial [Pirellulales bacterium]
MALAASLLLILLGYQAMRGIFRDAAPDPRRQLASDAPGAARSVSPDNPPTGAQVGDYEGELRRPAVVPPPDSADDVDRPATVQSDPIATDIAADSDQGDPLAPPAMDPTAAPTPDRVASSQSGIDSGQPYSAVSDEELLATINQMLRHAWQEAGMGPSPPATDSEWCRRVYLDIVGRIPSIEELEAFLRDRSRDKRARLVDRLLGEEYIEQYARNWTTIWTNTLVGRSGGQTPGSLVNREGLQQYLRRAMLHNKPYDQIVEELLSAEGVNTPGEEGFNGAVNFLLDNLDENGVTAAAKTGQIFLGVQIQCTQCHNHPFNEWQQDQFWGLNAFFRQARGVNLMDPAAPRSARLEDVDFAGELGDPREAEIFYELRNGQLRAAYPTFIDGAPINPSGLVDQVNRRDELARLVVQSPSLGQALVNRIWSHFFGYGFTKPVDDMGPHNSPSHPELLGRLGAHFAAGGHDLKR